MTFNPFSNFGQGAIKIETTEGTPVTPDVFFEFTKLDINVDYGKTAIGAVATKVAKTMRFRKGAINVSGSVEIFAEPKTLGYFLKSFFGSPTTSTLESGAVYLHEFTMANGNTGATMEFAEAGQNYVHRVFGAIVTKLSWSVEDNVLKLVVDFMGYGTFRNARVTVAASSGTTLKIDQTEGLRSSDTITVIAKEDGHTTVKELAITSVDDEETLTTATIDTQLDVGDIVVLNKQTPSYDRSHEFEFLGRSAYKMGDDIDNTAIKRFEDFTLEIERPGTGFHSADGYYHENRFVSAIKRTGLSAMGGVKRFYEDESLLDLLRQKESQAFRFESHGQVIGTNASAVQATKTFGSGNGFSVTATAAGSFDGEAGNDLNVVFVINSTDDLAAAISGNTITISLASTTSSKNTGTLIAAAVNALTGVDSAAEGTGAEEFTTAASKVNLAGGRDANQEEMLQIDVFESDFDVFNPVSEQDTLVSFDINYQGVYNENDDAVCRVRLRNSVSSY